MQNIQNMNYGTLIYNKIKVRVVLNILKDFVFFASVDSFRFRFVYFFGIGGKFLCVFGVLCIINCYF